MAPTQPELKYQNAAVQSAGPIGLVILLYDRLVSDLTKTSDAMRNNDIEGRCKAANHAFQVLQHLEGSLDMTKGGETALSLASIYGHIRGKLLEAQIKLSPEILTRQAETILSLRQAWNRADSPTAEAPPATAFQQVNHGRYGTPGEEHATSSWSA